MRPWARALLGLGTSGIAIAFAIVAFRGQSSIVMDQPDPNLSHLTAPREPFRLQVDAPEWVFVNDDIKLVMTVVEVDELLAAISPSSITVTFDSPDMAFAPEPPTVRLTAVVGSSGAMLATVKNPGNKIISVRCQHDMFLRSSCGGDIAIAAIQPPIFGFINKEILAVINTLVGLFGGSHLVKAFWDYLIARKTRKNREDRVVSGFGRR